jgi:hypothetical protein
LVIVYGADLICTSSPPPTPSSRSSPAGGEPAGGRAAAQRWALTLSAVTLAQASGSLQVGATDAGAGEEQVDRPERRLGLLISATLPASEMSAVNLTAGPRSPPRVLGAGVAGERHPRRRREAAGEGGADAPPGPGDATWRSVRSMAGDRGESERR